MERTEAEELVRAHCLATEEDTGYLPEELRVSEDIYIAITGRHSHQPVGFEGVALYMDPNLDAEQVEAA